MMLSRKRPFYLYTLAILVILILTTMLAAGCGGGKESGTNGDSKGEEKVELAWPRCYRDNLRTGRSPFSGPSTVNVLWQYEGGTTSFAWSMLGSDGRVISGFSGKLVCLDPKDGTVSWEFATGDASASTCSVKEDGIVYFSAGNSIYALNSEGEEQWSYDMGSEADEPALSDGGTVYAGSVGGKLAALSSNGKLEWEFEATGNIRSPSIDSDGNLYCSASPLVLYKIDKDGKKVWEFKPEGDLPLYEGMYAWANTLDYPSIGDDGTIYAGSFLSGGVTTSGQWIENYAMPEFGKLYAVTPDGQKKWEYYTPDGKFTIHSPTIGSDGTLYVGTSCWRVLALNPDSTLIWEFNTGEGQDVCPSIFSPSIGKDGLLYAATTSGKIFCITPQGTEQWRFAAENPWLPDMSRSNNFTPPAIGEDGVIFSTLFQGRVYAFGSSGAEK